jgi:lipopolysaccharide transport system ATP-binding protein
MSDMVISVENISKSYQLGTIGTGTFYGDLNRWWAKLRGFSDPYAKVGEKDHGNRDGETVWALKDINFQVRQGEAVGIIGRNGAGKSTLLKILSRVTAPTNGEIKVKGRVASLLEVGTGFHPELTGRENIFLNGAILGMNRRETKHKFDEIVDFSGVEKYIDTPVKRYSSGMYVRLAFAVAAHLEPEILVVDEVLAVGDAEFQKKCLGKMESVADGGRTVLFVSHNMLAMRSLCSTSILLEGGQIKDIGNTEDIISAYLNVSSVDRSRLLWADPETAPGDNVARLRSLCIRKQDGNIDPTIAVDEPFLMEVDVWKLNDLEKCDVVLSIFKDGIRVFSTGTIVFDFDSINTKHGILRFRCEVPANLFNTGIYQIALIILKDGAQPALKMPDALSFEVRENVNLRAGHYGDWLGVVRPALNWKVNLIKDLTDGQ